MFIINNQMIILGIQRLQSVNWRAVLCTVSGIDPELDADFFYGKWPFILKGSQSLSGELHFKCRQLKYFKKRQMTQSRENKLLQSDFSYHVLSLQIMKRYVLGVWSLLALWCSCPSYCWLVSPQKHALFALNELLDYIVNNKATMQQVMVLSWPWKCITCKDNNTCFVVTGLKQSIFWVWK